MDTTQVEAAAAVYAQVCGAHSGISDFRAKLLAVLPIASGGAFLLINDKLGNEAIPHLFALGVFGALVTLGLFLYELRGIHRCVALERCGKALEKQLLQGTGVLRGTFIPDRKSVWRGLVGVTTASLIIYPTVIGVWSYVACLGTKRFSPGDPKALLTSGAILLFFIAFGGLAHWEQVRQLNENMPNPED